MGGWIRRGWICLFGADFCPRSVEQSLQNKSFRAFGLKIGFAEDLVGENASKPTLDPSRDIDKNPILNLL